MRSQQLFNILSEVIVTDIRNANGSVTGYVIGGQLKGGWEGWLQVEFAKQVLLAGRGEAIREARYPTGARCDLYFQGVQGEEEVGVPIWVELKTQRSGNYAHTAADFVMDIDKIDAIRRVMIPTAEGEVCFQDGNVMVAIAVFLERNNNDIDILNMWRLHGGGSLAYYALNRRNRPWVWERITETIRDNQNYPVLAMYKIDI